MTIAEGCSLKRIWIASSRGSAGPSSGKSLAAEPRGVAQEYGSVVGEMVLETLMRAE